MTPEVRLELEGLVEELQALSRRLRRHHQPLATQLLEMALLEIKSRMFGIDDEEVQALVDTLSGQDTLRSSDGSSEETELEEPSEQPEGLATSTPPARVVIALSEIGRSKRKRRN
jgi:hypothetical protein